MTKHLSRIVRNILGRYGLELKQRRTATLRLWDVLSGWSRAGSERNPAAIHVFDQDCRVQAEFLRNCDPARVRLWGFEQAYSSGAVPAPSDDRQPFWISLSMEQTPLAGFFRRAGWTAKAEVVYVRATLGELSAGEYDLAEIVGTAADHGLKLVDVSILAEAVVANAACDRVVLILARPGPPPDPARDASFAGKRVDDALAFLSPVVGSRRSFQRIAGRGSFGFAAGVFNPGAIRIGDRQLALVRAERDTWPEQERDQLRHFRSCVPLLLRFGDAGEIVNVRELGISAPFDLARARLEDFRLFTHGDRVYCNHTVVTLPNWVAPRSIPVSLHEQIARVGISELDVEKGSLTFLGFPEPSFPTGKIEKNWATFSDEGKVSFIYSISPYRVLQSTDWPGMSFVERLNANVRLPIQLDGALIRNSVNPVVYSTTHLLHIVHRVFPSKQYVYWALLLDRKTLLPMYISDRPLVRAGAAVSTSILYLCSVVVDPLRVHLYCGVDDIGCGKWMIDRAKLDQLWRPLG